MLIWTEQQQWVPMGGWKFTNPPTPDTIINAERYLAYLRESLAIPEFRLVSNKDPALHARAQRLRNWRV